MTELFRPYSPGGWQPSPDDYSYGPLITNIYKDYVCRIATRNTLEEMRSRIFDKLDEYIVKYFSNIVSSLKLPKDTKSYKLVVDVTLFPKTCMSRTIEVESHLFLISESEKKLYSVGFYPELCIETVKNTNSRTSKNCTVLESALLREYSEWRRVIKHGVD